MINHYFILLSLPIIGALIGWGTNFIAVKMLFRPRVPRNFLGLRFHGVIPARQIELARSIGETVESQLISHRDLQDALQRPEVNAELAKTIEAEVERFMNERLSANPLIAIVMQGPLANELKRMVVKQLHASTPQILERLVGTLEKHMSFKQIVQQRVEEFDIATLENLIQRIASRELRAIEIWGGVLGFLVGAFQAGLSILLVVRGFP